MSTTQQPEALNLEEFRAKVTHAAREPLLARIAELEDVADMAIKRIADLEAQLSAIGAGGVEPLRKREASAAVAVPMAEAWEQSAADTEHQRTGAGLHFNQGVAEGLRICAKDLRAALAATPAADAPKNVWQQAVDKELVSAHLGVAGNVTPAEAAKALHELIYWNVEVAINPKTNGGKVLVPAAAPVVSDAQIKAVFLANGFTIKPGHDDLKPYVYQAARALLVTGGHAQAVERITIDMKQTAELLDLFGGEPTEFTVMQCNWHSGPGLYAYVTEYPEDGASYLGKTDCEAQPAPQVQADARDAARYRWLRNQILGVDFDWCGNGITALVFEVPDGCAYSRNCDQSIDAAVAAQAKQGEQE